MNAEEIQRGISKLSPDELSRFRVWFKDYVDTIEAGEVHDSREVFEDRLKKLRGSLKGTGILKALMEDRRKESPL